MKFAETIRGVEPLAGVTLPGTAWSAPARALLPAAALELVATLHRTFEPGRRALLAARVEREGRWDEGALPGYLPETELPEARGDWRIAPLSADLLRRRVEITGPIANRKLVIQMLSRNDAGEVADAAMLDFEDSQRPTWENLLAGLENLIGAADGTLEHIQADRVYRLNAADMPLVMTRVRGLHLVETNLRVDGEPVSGGLLELALAAFHTARRFQTRGRTPKFYVPKCEHHLEARWWNELFRAIEDGIDLRRGALRATFLIETLPAAFQVEEILWELRERVAGLNVGRWDKIFSDIKVLKEHPDRVLADRGTISLERPWMRSYAEHLVRVCHRHGAFGMGGMAAFTPGRSAELRAVQVAKVSADKRFEAELGHDGCWVSHPYFIGAALAAFPRDHQLDVLPDIADRPDLLPRGGGPRSRAGLAKNIRVGIAYLKGWNDGLGCIAWDDLMEDLATLEISRAQTWQWLRHGIELDGCDDETASLRVDRELVAAIFAEELARIRAGLAETIPDPELRERETALYAAAARDAESLFTETRLRPFLAEATPQLD